MSAAHAVPGSELVFPDTDSRPTAENTRERQKIARLRTSLRTAGIAPDAAAGP